MSISVRRMVTNGKARLEGSVPSGKESEGVRLVLSFHLHSHYEHFTRFSMPALKIEEKRQLIPTFSI